MTWKCRRCDSDNCDEVDGWVVCRDCGYRWKVWDRQKKPIKADPNFCDRIVDD